MNEFNFKRRNSLKSIVALGTAGSLGAWSSLVSAQKALTVGVIYVGAKDDFGYNQAQAEAAAELKKMPGIKVVEEENVAETVAVQKTMTGMIVQDGATLLFPSSFGYFDPHVLAVAAKYPNIRFAHCGGLWTEGKHPKNVGSYFGYIDECQYLNGIIAGHGRLAAARKLGLDQVPVIELAHLTVAQKRALVIADNRLALDAGWDEEMLALELAELSDAGYDLALTGFEEAEIEALLTGAVAVADDESESEADESDAADDVPEVPVMAVSRPGDVWAIGAHRLICGDATDRDVVAALMQGEVSRLCFTSPPYGNQRDYTSGGISDWDGLMRGVFAHLKPVELVERAIRNSSRPGNVVLDPFGGSGTTLIAAEKSGRIARLIELDPKYVDVIVRRWEEFTGKQATREADGALLDQATSDSSTISQ